MTKYVLVAILFLAGCGSAKAIPVPTVTTSPAAAPVTTIPAKVNYADVYTSIVTPANKAAIKFQTQAAQLPASATGPDAAKITAPLAAAWRAVDEQLLRVAWPVNVESDMKAMVVASSVFVADLENVANQTTFSLGAWENQLSGDAGKLGGQVSIVRADLGLPPKA